MARAVANVAVSVTARTSKFRKGLGRVKKSLKGFRGGVGFTVRRLAGFGAALAAVATGGGMVVFIKNSFRAIDATAKFAKLVGLTTEQLTGLQHSASLAGVSIETAQMAIQRMTRRVAEAAVGTGEAIKAIKELGLNAVEINKLGTNEVLFRIADAMQKVGTEADQVRLSMKLFDSEGVKMANVMRGGADALRAAMLETEQLGASFSKIDASQVEEANNTMARMRLVFKGLGNTLAIHVAPIITAIGTRFVEAAKNGKAMRTAVIEAFRGMTRGAAVFLDWMKLVEGVWNSLKATIQGAATGILGLFEKLVGAAAKLEEFLGLDSTAMRKLESDMGMWADEMANDTIASIDEARKAFDDFANGKTKKDVLRFFDDIQQAAENAAAPKGKKKSFLTTWLDDLKKAGGGARGAVESFGEWFGAVASKGVKKNFFSAFGGLASSFFGRPGKSKVGASQAPAGSFREVDLGRVAIGGAKGLNKAQKVEDKAVVAAVDRSTLAINNISGLGLGR